MSEKWYDNSTTYRHSVIDLHAPCATVSFWMILSDDEWLSKIFNNTKRRAVSLRQLSYLFYIYCEQTCMLCVWGVKLDGEKLTDRKQHIINWRWKMLHCITMEMHWHFESPRQLVLCFTFWQLFLDHVMSETDDLCVV